MVQWINGSMDQCTTPGRRQALGDTYMLDQSKVIPFVCLIVFAFSAISILADDPFGLLPMLSALPPLVQAFALALVLIFSWVVRTRGAGIVRSSWLTITLCA